MIIRDLLETTLCSAKKGETVCSKVEKIQEDSLDSIPSPSMKIQIIGGKVYLRCKGKTLQGDVNKLLKTKNAQQCFAFTPQANFRAHNLNFPQR